jgi:hypothetical protein
MSFLKEKKSKELLVIKKQERLADAHFMQLQHVIILVKSS